MKRVETALNAWFWSSCPWKVGKKKHPQHLFFQSDDCHPPEWCNCVTCVLLHRFPRNLGPKNHQANPLPPPPPTEMNPSLVDRFCGDLGCVDLASRRLSGSLEETLENTRTVWILQLFSDEFYLPIFLSIYLIFCIYLYFFLTCRNRLPCVGLFSLPSTFPCLGSSGLCSQNLKVQQNSP